MSEAVILIDAAGTILHHNSAAADLFGSQDGITTADRRLKFSDKSATDRFGRALHELTLGSTANAANPDIATRAFVVARLGGKRPYLVALRCLPRPDPGIGRAPPGAGASVIVVIRDPAEFSGVDADLLRQSYNLSPAEIDLAVALDRGAAVRDIAMQRGVAITTVRTQLYALMGKLDVNRQIELIRLLRQYRLPF